MTENKSSAFDAAAIIRACKVLANIADQYDDNNLDDEARKRWGDREQHLNVTDPAQIILYENRGGKTLLTLADCLAAREALRAK